MNKKIQSILITILLVNFSLSSAISQERLQPGRIYNPGEEINAPMIGLTATIPEGWAGYLPTDTEMLMLANLENSEGTIYALPFDDTMEDIKERLSRQSAFEKLGGFALSGGDTERRCSRSLSIRSPSDRFRCRRIVGSGLGRTDRLPRASWRF